MMCKFIYLNCHRCGVYSSARRSAVAIDDSSCCTRLPLGGPAGTRDSPNQQTHPTSRTWIRSNIYLWCKVVIRGIYLPSYTSIVAADDLALGYDANTWNLYGTRHDYISHGNYTRSTLSPMLNHSRGIQVWPAEIRKYFQRYTKVTHGNDIEFDWFAGNIIR